MVEEVDVTREDLKQLESVYLDPEGGYPDPEAGR